MVRDYISQKCPWRKGKIIGRRGNVIWLVKVGKLTWRRHTNQIRRRNIELNHGDSLNNDGSIANEDQQSIEQGCDADEDQQSIDLFNGPNLSDGDDHQRTEMADIGRDGGDVEVQSNGHAEVHQQLRRSKRATKPPNRLSY
ncbi:unnamed protein product [Anisakis simplex]|uniref:DUF5641 domain-containing protein n=1 Tax=Anisakis simplex TaxID=6269 RepID=A0A0M3J6Q6_ANISI|nr:unnamed protein product [Anisakis simplex]